MFPIEKMTPTQIPKYINIYPNMYKYKQDIYKIAGGDQAAAARPGPEPRAGETHGWSL